MGKLIAMTVLALVLGFVGGSIVMMGCHFATMPIYPPPDGLDVMDPANETEIHAWMETLPDGAFVLAALCHWIGTAVGALIAMFITGRRRILPALLVGVLFLIAGTYNVMSVPHPSWFPFVDILGYMPVAWLMGRWLLRAPEAVAE